MYGGASPEVKADVVTEEKPKEIYGGANPLENTQPVPVSEVKEAYGGEKVVPEEVKPEPAAEPAPEVKVEAAPAPEAKPASGEPEIEKLDF